MAAATDPTILEWAAAHQLILLTHDSKTMPSFVIDRVAAGKAMPGVFLVDDQMPIGRAIDELLLAAGCLTPEECKDLVRYFPM